LSQRCCRIGMIAADWRSRAGLSVIVREIIPTRSARAVRKHLGANRIHSPASANLSQVVDRLLPRLYPWRHTVGNF
jgi:hypothetical protein